MKKEDENEEVIVSLEDDVKDAEEKEEEVVDPQVKIDKLKTKTGEDTMASLMEELGDNLLPFAEGELVEASVLAVSGNRIWVDVAGQSLGFIPEKEISSKTGLKKGDKIYASVISLDNEDGNVVLSMRQADREKYWKDMTEKHDSGEAVSVQITDANKGGLITEIGGIQGFLPVSQLTPEHYPRVTGGDKDEILNRLRQFIGTDLAVKVINCDRENNKLIFSEKAVNATEIKTKIDKYAVGDKIKGRVTGIVDFGLFISLDPQIEGLIHISEVSWSRVTDLNRIYKVGDFVDAMIIGIENGRISLSLKRLQRDPWVEAASKFKVGSIVTGNVTKITPFGAFVSIEDGIDGLVHVSELSNDHIVDPGQIVSLGKDYKFKIISIEPESHRLGLSLKEAGEGEKKVKADKESTTLTKDADLDADEILRQAQDDSAESVQDDNVEEKPKAKKVTKAKIKKEDKIEVSKVKKPARNADSSADAGGESAK